MLALDEKNESKEFFKLSIIHVYITEIKLSRSSNFKSQKRIIDKLSNAALLMTNFCFQQSWVLMSWILVRDFSMSIRRLKKVLQDNPGESFSTRDIIDT